MVQSADSLPLRREAWERVEELFAQALELPGGQRGAFLDFTCSADVALRREVESLLAAHDNAGALDDLGARLSPQVDAALAERRAGALQVEGYRLLSRIGAGGMGEVFLAEREGEGFCQRVAVKVLQSPGHDATLVSRFLAERRILASLEHCGIPRFLDGGLTSEGAPYVAMELVDGTPIDQYCDAQRLPTSARLELFADVCEAIHHAHQHLVVHRDLKPANILVTTTGSVKVLDFGIAKILSPQPGTEVSPETRAWMTLPYASPEQVRGEAITTSVDVYALGVLLFELLTGRRPFEGESVRALQDAILGQDPPALPAMATAELAAARGVPLRRLAREFAGDLENIVACAMHKSASRRYESARELAGDVRRHLAGLPVRARPDTLSYRVRKFVLRHRRLVALAAVAVIAIAAGLVSTVVASRRAHLNAERATIARERAEQVSRFVIGLFRNANPLVGPAPGLSARALLDSGVAHMRTDLAQQPEARATMLTVLSESYEGLGHIPEARATIDEAVRLLDEVRSRDTLAVAKALGQQARMLIVGSQPDSGRVTAQRALALFRRAGAGADEIALELATLSDAFTAAGQLDSAEYYVRAAAERAREGRNPEARASRLDDLAAVLAHRGRWHAVDSVLTEVIVLRSRTMSPDHPTVASTVGARGRARILTGAFLDARSDLAVALRDLAKVLGDDHPFVANTLQDLGRVHEALGDLDAASLAYARSAGIKEQRFGRSIGLARVLRLWGTLEARRGRLADAESLLVTARAMRAGLPGDSAVELALTDVVLGTIDRQRGRMGAALTRLEHALPALRTRLPATHRDLAAAEAEYGLTLVAAGRHHDAESILRRAHVLLEKDPEARHRVRLVTAALARRPA